MHRLLCSHIETLSSAGGASLPDTECVDVISMGWGKRGRGQAVNAEQSVQGQKQSGNIADIESSRKQQYRSCRDVDIRRKQVPAGGAQAKA